MGDAPLCVLCRRRPVDERWRPFCGERCRNEDLARWDELNRLRPVTGVAGNDAHQNVRIGNLLLDPYELSLGFVSTHVLAEELTPEAILRALREGRAYVAFEFVAPAPPMRAWEPPAAIEGAELRAVPGTRRVEAARGGRPWIYWNPFRGP